MPDQSIRGTSFKRWVSRLAWGYLAFVLCYWLFLRQGDDWWPATIAMCVPRWPVAIPLAVLIPLSMRWPRRLLLPVGIGLLVFAWPVLNAVVNVPKFGPMPATGQAFKFISLNADGNDFSRDALKSLIETEVPDVVSVQEGVPDLEDPDFWGSGWQVKKGPVGLIVASRFALQPIDTFRLNSIGGTGAAASFWLESPLGRIFLVDVHLDTPRGGLEAMISGGNIDQLRENITRRELGSGLILGWLIRARPPGALVIAGDFNMTSDSVIYRHYWSQYTDSYGETGFGWGYTKHTSWHGVRIDHILHGDAFSCTDCRVGPDVGSDHRPVIAVLRPATLSAD
jgi:endonuclease/exonuclease/phosphatase (EEP) superfamily protein YafD